jgi:serine/threonine protein kinase
MEAMPAVPDPADDDTPPVPFARPRSRAPRASLELPPELTAGAVGGFTLEAPIGQGGMSWTFRARRPSNGELVALKVLDPNLARDQGGELVQRFLREGQAATRLRHPNIVGALDHGTCPTTGLHFIALELVEGQTAEDLLALRGVLPEAEALNIALGVAQALSCLEQNGVIHRDVKPTNILVDAAGTAKLADLGVAKLLDAGSLTTIGAMIGTPHYIAPEQAIALDQVDIRADLYALGVTLFRLVTGKFPFAGDEFMELVTRHVNEDLPDPRQFVAGVTEDTARLIATLAARDPADRYPSARAAAEDLARVLLGQTAQGIRTAPRNGASAPSPAPTPASAPPPAPARTPTPAPPRPQPSQPKTTRVREATPVPATRAPARPPSGVSAPAGARTKTPVPASAARATSPTLRITVRTGANVLSRKKFDQDLITIGREPRCDVQIDNPMVSRHHCEVRRTGARFLVLERNTTNGTYLNGKRVEGTETELKPGDVIGVTKKFDVEVAWDILSSPPTPPPDYAEQAEEKDPAEQTFFDEGESDMGRTPLTGSLDLAPAPAAGAEAVAVAEAGRGRVAFTRNGQAHRQVIEEWFQVGRSAECDLRLDSNFAPRKAYVIVRGPTAYHLFNVAPYPSTVLVNGHPTDDIAVLNDGDKVSAYGSEVVFEAC